MGIPLAQEFRTRLWDWKTFDLTPVLPTPPFVPKPREWIWNPPLSIKQHPQPSRGSRLRISMRRNCELFCGSSSRFVLMEPKSSFKGWESWCNVFLFICGVLDYFFSLSYLYTFWRFLFGSRRGGWNTMRKTSYPDGNLDLAHKEDALETLTELLVFIQLLLWFTDKRCILIDRSDIFWFFFRPHRCWKFGS